MAAKKPAAKTRQVKVSAYRSFRLDKRVKHSTKPLAGSFKIFRQSLRHLKKHWRLMLGIVAVYLVLTIVFVKGLSGNTGLAELKETFNTLFTDGWSQLTSGLALFVVMLSSAASTSTGIASLYQTILLVLASLAVIWALRQSHAAQPVTVRDAFYKGMYPLVPFLLVLAVIGLQLVPVFVASWLYSIIIAGGIAVTSIEQALSWLIIGLLTLLTLYMLSSSLLALYIVTLPEMKPMQALRSAREIVRYRRWTVLRKILALPFMLLLTGAVLMLPLILWATPIAEWSLFVLNMGVLAVAHSYMYSLYRELL